MGLFKKLKKLANPVSVLKKTDPLAKKVLNSKVGKTLAKADPMLARANKASMPKRASRPTGPARPVSSVIKKTPGMGRRPTY